MVSQRTLIFYSRPYFFCTFLLSTKKKKKSYRLFFFAIVTLNKHIFFGLTEMYIRIDRLLFMQMYLKKLFFIVDKGLSHNLPDIQWFHLCSIFHMSLTYYGLIGFLFSSQSFNICSPRLVKIKNFLYLFHNISYEMNTHLRCYI